jgi:hypothetical protein
MLSARLIIVIIIPCCVVMVTGIETENGGLLIR